jgi:hypothetical protein
MTLAFYPGLSPETPRLLGRFLPPVAEGVAAHYVQRHTRPGDLVVDPFGQAPQVAVEALSLDRRVVVATLNPVARLAVSLAVRPPSVAELRGALTRLGDAPVGLGSADRLEPQLLALYQTECAECQAKVTADYFDWDSEAGEPVEKGYICLACGGPRRAATSLADREQARRFSRNGPDYHFLLGRLAGPNDPDRAHVEEALAVYPTRTLTAIGAVVVKFEGLALDRNSQRLLAGLLVAALDEATVLGQDRPKVLAVPRRFRELNFWLALERAVGLVAGLAAPDRAMGLDDLLAAPGGAAIHAYAGPMRELAGMLPPGACPLVISGLPRPSQAFWTLSALWTAWIWGRAQAEPLWGMLRRRRYDWNWHARGLERTLAAARPALAAEGYLVALVGEAEPGLSAAALAAGARAGYRLDGFALRADTGEAQAQWTPAVSEAPAVPAAAGLAQRVREAMAAALRARAEPSRWAHLHAAAWVAVARGGGEATPPAEGDDVLGPVNRAIEAAARDTSVFSRLGADAGDEPTTGLWWLVNADSSNLPGAPLADRVETAAWQRLTAEAPVDEHDLLPSVYAAFPGALTPGRALVMACLEACGQRLEAGLWQLRPEDTPGQRADDQASILAHLRVLGVRNGFEVKDSNPQAWREGGQSVYVFAVLTAATLSAHLLRPPPTARRRFLVLPGGRAGLAEVKLRRDPRLRQALLASDWRIVKYRHVRRMAADAALTRATLEPALGGDPLEAAQQLALPE